MFSLKSYTDLPPYHYVLIFLSLAQARGAHVRARGSRSRQGALSNFIARRELAAGHRSVCVPPRIAFTRGDRIGTQSNITNEHM